LAQLTKIVSYYELVLFGTGLTIQELLFIFFVKYLKDIEVNKMIE